MNLDCRLTYPVYYSVFMCIHLNEHLLIHLLFSILYNFVTWSVHCFGVFLECLDTVHEKRNWCRFCWDCNKLLIYVITLHIIAHLGFRRKTFFLWNSHIKWHLPLYIDLKCCTDAVFLACVPIYILWLNFVSGLWLCSWKTLQDQIPLPPTWNKTFFLYFGE